MADTNSIVNTRNRGGRPRAAQPRLHRVVVHLSEPELAAVQSAAAGRNVAVYARETLLNRRRQIASVPPINAEVAATLGRIGNNLNQLARQANSGFVVNCNVDLAELRRLLDAIWMAALARPTESTE